MKRYACSKCGKEIVVRALKENIEIKCCNGDTPVKHTETVARVVVPVGTLPKVMTDNKPLPLSKPAPPETPVKPVGIVPATK